MKVVPINITMREGNLLLVNANFALHKEDKSDLVSATQSYPEILVKKNVSEVLQQVFQKIGCEEPIVPVSGYRTVEEQTQIYETSLRENGEAFTQKFVALPYHSEHQTDRISKKISVAGLSISALLMLAEGVTLHMFDLQRHDSMYFALLPCMYFLFVLLVQPKGQRKEKLRTMALVIYIIHPMVIVAVRLVAKTLRLQTLLIENSLIHYLAVCIVSAIISFLFAKVQNKVKGKRNTDCVEKSKAWIEIDLNNLSHNVKTLNKILPEKCELMAVVKAQAYGHGAYKVATHINRLGVKAFAVATIDEGIELRRYGITGEILILGYTAPMRAKELRK